MFYLMMLKATITNYISIWSTMNLLKQLSLIWFAHW